MKNNLVLFSNHLLVDSNDIRTIYSNLKKYFYHLIKSDINTMHLIKFLILIFSSELSLFNLKIYLINKCQYLLSLTYFDIKI